MKKFTSIAEGVQFGADAFERAEKAAARSRKDGRDMRGMFEIIRDEGVMGGLEAGALACEVDEMFTRHEAEIWAMHSRLTKKAQELGIDLPQRDGGR